MKEQASDSRSDSAATLSTQQMLLRLGAYLAVMSVILFVAAGRWDWGMGWAYMCLYGIIIAIAGCLRGMQCSKSASAVGEAATSAVVTGIVFIILAEAVLTVVYTVLDV